MTATRSTLRRRRRLYPMVTLITSLIAAAAFPAGASTGQSWTAVPIQSPVGNYSTETKAGLACASPDDCFTAYSTQDEQNERDGRYSGAYIQHWDGQQFSLVDSNAPATSDLEGLDCPGVHSCFVAGESFTTVGRPLIDHWNGTRWEPMQVPAPTYSAWLLDVSCAGTSSCIAVGGRGTTGSAYHAFAERWDGQSWAIMHVPHPGTQTADELLSVSCPASQRCIAVGLRNERSSNKLRAFSEVRNGTTWRLVSLPHKHPRTELHAITCPNTKLCFAVGDYWPFTTDRAFGLIEKWDGNSWSAQSAPAMTKGSHVLNDIDCTSDTECATVGWTRNKSGRPQGATAVWNGTAWQKTPLENPRQADTLTAVACWRHVRCLTVGDQWTDRTLTQLKQVADALALR